MTLKHDRQFTISVCKSRKDTNLKQKNTTFSEFCEQLRNPIRGTETLSEFLKLPKSQQDDRKDVGGPIGGTFSGSRRKADAVIGRDVLALDLDNIPAGQTNQVVAKTKALNCCCCIHSTRKHSPSTPKLRIYILLDRTVTPDEYAPIARLVAAQIGMEWIDKTTFEPSRLMY